MAPEVTNPHLDVGRDDYYGHDRTDCLDLAKSPFLDPLPEDAVAPAGYPMVLAAPDDALPMPGLTDAEAPGLPALEAQLASKPFRVALNATNAPVLGVAAIRRGSGIQLAVATGRQQMIVDRASVGYGPLRTRTVAFTIRKAVPDRPTLSGHLTVDGQRLAAPWQLSDNRPRTIVASVPVTGNHKITIGVETGAKDWENYDHSFKIDAKARPERVLTANP